MAKASDNLFPSILLAEASAPATPAAGSQRLFLDAADDTLKRVDSSGVVTAVGGSGGGGGVAVSKVNGNNAGDVATTSTAFVDVTGALSVPAAAGDELELTFQAILYLGTNATGYAELKFLTNGVQAGPLFRHHASSQGLLDPKVLTYTHTVVAGDLSGGNVPVKVQHRSSNGSTQSVVTNNGGYFWQLVVKNLGQ